MGGTACFGVFCVKIRPRPLAVASCKNPHATKTNTFLVRKVTHAQKRNAWADRDELLHRCTGIGVHDVITCADLYYDRLQGLGVAGGQILGLSIDLLRPPYNTLALPCECVIEQNRIEDSQAVDAFLRGRPFALRDQNRVNDLSLFRHDFGLRNL